MTETIKFNFDFGVSATRLGTRMTEQTWDYFGRFFDSFSLAFRTRSGKNFSQEIIDNPNLETAINDLSDDSKDFIVAMAAEISKDFPTAEEKPTEETFYHVGQLFSNGGGNVYQIKLAAAALVRNKVALCKIHGDYYAWKNNYNKSMTKVGDTGKITVSEFKVITDGVKFISITKDEADKIIAGLDKNGLIRQ